MSERDELAETILRHYSDTITAVQARNAANAAINAGYSKPRTITTAEELDALPKDSVVLSGGVVPRIKASGNRWLGEVIDVDSEHIIRWTNYATVLHEPEAAS